jgi:hypothetical protein
VLTQEPNGINIKKSKSRETKEYTQTKVEKQGKLNHLGNNHLRNIYKISISSKTNILIIKK